MGRNNRVRSHRYIPNGKKKPKRTFNWKGLIQYSNHVNAEQREKLQEKTVLLNACLLLFPWAVLFLMGALVSPVYAQGTDVSTKLDTMVFLAGGLAVFIIAVVFAIMLKGKGKK